MSDCEDSEHPYLMMTAETRDKSNRSSHKRSRDSSPSESTSKRPRSNETVPSQSSQSNRKLSSSSKSHNSSSKANRSDTKYKSSSNNSYSKSNSKSRSSSSRKKHESKNKSNSKSRRRYKDSPRSSPDDHRRSKQKEYSYDDEEDEDESSSHESVSSSSSVASEEEDSGSSSARSHSDESSSGEDEEREKHRRRHSRPSQKRCSHSENRTTSNEDSDENVDHDGHDQDTDSEGITRHPVKNPLQRSHLDKTNSSVAKSNASQRSSLKQTSIKSAMVTKTTTATRPSASSASKTDQTPKPRKPRGTPGVYADQEYKLYDIFIYGSEKFCITFRGQDAPLTSSGVLNVAECNFEHTSTVEYVDYPGCYRAVNLAPGVKPSWSNPSKNPKLMETIAKHKERWPDKAQAVKRKLMTNGHECVRLMWWNNEGLIGIRPTKHRQLSAKKEGNTKQSIEIIDDTEEGDEVEASRAKKSSGKTTLSPQSKALQHKQDLIKAYCMQRVDELLKKYPKSQLPTYWRAIDGLRQQLKQVLESDPDYTQMDIVIKEWICWVKKDTRGLVFFGFLSTLCFDDEEVTQNIRQHLPKSERDHLSSSTASVTTNTQKSVMKKETKLQPLTLTKIVDSSMGDDLKPDANTDNEEKEDEKEHEQEQEQEESDSVPFTQAPPTKAAHTTIKLSSPIKTNGNAVYREYIEIKPSPSSQKVLKSSPVKDQQKTVTISVSPPRMAHLVSPPLIPKETPQETQDETMENNEEAGASAAAEEEMGDFF